MLGRFEIAAPKGPGSTLCGFDLVDAAACAPVLRPLQKHAVAIGLLGDSNGGCSSLSGSVPHHDDLAIGLGLQSCRDNNGCANGGSGHAAGDSRGANGVDDSGNFGPWFVFGR